MIKDKRSIFVMITLMIILSLAIVVNASAATTSGTGQQNGDRMGQPPEDGGMGGPGMGKNNRMGIMGTVSAVSGTTVTMSGHRGFATTTADITYTVDASNATVMKNNATSTVSSIAIGDTVDVQGTVSGTNITATIIRDGMGDGMSGRGQDGNKNASSTPISIEGDGQPVVMGTVSSVSGSTLIITNKSNIQYTIDASGAKVTKDGNTISVSGISTGDNVVVQGSINGTSVTATTIIDETPKNSDTASTTPNQLGRGFFRRVGSFISHLFGF